MTNLSASKPSISTAAVGFTLLAAASLPATPLQAAFIETRNTRPVNPTGNQFSGSVLTGVKTTSPANGVFTMMQERWTP